MQIAIIGHGFVGRATEFVFSDSPTTSTNKSPPRTLVIHDPAKGMSVKDAVLLASDCVFICVPTPPLDDGSCDGSLVLEYVRLLRNSTKPVIVRSTIIPSIVQQCRELCPNFVYMPEFLREAHWEQDALSPTAIIIGADNHHLFNTVVDILSTSKISGSALANAKRVDPITASLYKYATNGFLATKVVFMHELYSWMCSSDLGHLWPDLEDALSADQRIGASHLRAPGHHGLGYAGSCFPKDMMALAKAGGDALSLVNAAIASNVNLRKFKPEPK